MSMMFTGTKQKVVFTSEHMHEVPTEPKINDVNSLSRYLNNHRKEGPTENQKSPIELKLEES